MRSLRPRLFTSPSLALSLCLAFAATGCGLPDAGDGAREALTGAHADREPAYSRCSPADLAAVDAIVASEDGITLGTTEGADAERGLVARSYRGRGCSLVPDGRTPAAITELFDEDDRGNLYALPRTSTTPGLLSTMPTDGFTPSGQVVRIDPQGRISTVVSAGRGIWSFGVSPRGGIFWSEGCGPTGIFAMGSNPLRSVIKPTSRTWISNGAVLTSDETMWFIGDPPCQLQGPRTQDCRLPLLRSTPASSDDVTVTMLELDGRFGSSGTRLARCGARPCAVITHTILVWNDDGTVAHKIPASDLGLGSDERIEKIAGNQTGLYALLSSSTERRLVFVPLRP